MNSTVTMLRRLLRFGRPHRKLLVRSFGAMAVLGLTTGAYAWMTGPALSYLLSGGSRGVDTLLGDVPFLEGLHIELSRETLLWGFPALIVLIGLIKGVAYLGQFYWTGLYGQRVSLDLRRELFLRLTRLSPLQLSKERTGDLLSRFTTDVAAVETAATYAVGSYLRDGLQILILAGVALAQEWRLALATMIILPIAAWPASRFTRSFLKRTRRGQEGLGLLAAQVQEGLGGLRTIQAFNAQEAERVRFSDVSRGQVRAFIRAAWVRGAVPGLMEILAAGALAGVLAYAAATQAVPPERLISLLMAIVLLYQPVKDLGRVTQFALAASVAGERIFKILDAPQAVREDSHSGDVVLPPLLESIRFDDVHFSWADRAALRGVSLELPVGKVTALVGPSGGGKSTLLSLLLRFEPPSSGRIVIDGVDVTEASTDSVRRQFALVTQEPLLFSTTVRENLRFARPDATEEELVQAARTAHADAFIRSLPHGYDTEIGERGVRLSGGQKQRLCLARAVLANAPVLVLDEATSNLDPESEREVQQALSSVLRGRTALVIAHRLATVVEADCIVVLQEGQVRERGAHADLLQAGGLYARLWALQNAPHRAEAQSA